HPSQKLDPVSDPFLLSQILQRTFEGTRTDNPKTRFNVFKRSYQELHSLVGDQPPNAKHGWQAIPKFISLLAAGLIQFKAGYRNTKRYNATLFPVFGNEPGNFNMSGRWHDDAIRAPVKSFQEWPVQSEQVALPHDVAVELRNHGNVPVRHECGQFSERVG